MPYLTSGEIKKVGWRVCDLTWSLESAKSNEVRRVHLNPIQTAEIKIQACGDGHVGTEKTHT